MRYSSSNEGQEEATSASSCRLDFSAFTQVRDEKAFFDPDLLDSVGFAEMRDEMFCELPKLLDEDDGRRAGWAHDHFCDDGTRLTWDRSRPYQHICPRCGAGYRENRHHAAWVTMLRNLRFAALTYACGMVKRDPSIMAVILPHFDSLAKNYTRFPLMDGWDCRHGAAHLMGTALEESMAICTIAVGLVRVWSLLDATEQAALREGFLRPAFDLQLQYLHDFPRTQSSKPGTELDWWKIGFMEKPHNIVVWHCCALVCAALMLEDDGRTDEVINAPFGLKWQLEYGIQDDGLWIEGSLGYHYFALIALTHTMIVAQGMKRVVPGLRDSILKMSLAPADLYFSNGTAPNYGDTSSPIRMENSSVLYRQINRLVDDQDVAELLRRTEGGRYHCREEVRNSPGFRIVKASWGQWEFAVKYGHSHYSHNHPDVGSLIVLLAGKSVVTDLGSSGYGSDSHRWDVSPMSHNTVVVDDAPGRLTPLDEEFHRGMSMGQVEICDNRVTIEGNLNAECRLRRELSYKDGVVEDVTTVFSDSVHTWTWWMHFNEPFDGLNTLPAERRFRDVPYITETRSVLDRNVFNTGAVSLDIGARDDAVFLVTSPGNAEVDRRYGIAWEKKGKEAVFVAQWSSVLSITGA